MRNSDGNGAIVTFVMSFLLKTAECPFYCFVDKDFILLHLTTKSVGDAFAQVFDNIGSTHSADNDELTFDGLAIGQTIDRVSVMWPPLLAGDRGGLTP